MTLTEPTWAEIIREAGEERERDMFTALVGVVQSYNPGPPGPPTIDVLPVIKRALFKEDNTRVHRDLPVISNVPVAFPSAGSFSLTFPLAKGDHVLLVCTNWSHQKWRTTGNISEPGDLRTHELGNAFAIPGVLPQTGSLETDPADTVMDPSGVVKVGPSAADFVAMNQKVLDEIAAVHASVKVHTHSGVTSGMGVSGPPVWTPPTDEYDPSADVASTKLKSE